MAEAAESAISEIINVLRTVSGIENVPLNPPSVMSYATFGLVYPFSGSYTMGSPTGTKRECTNIAIDILTKEIDIARSIERMKPLIDTVSMAFGREISYDSDGSPGDQFNNTIETFSTLDYSWIPQTDYAGIQVIGLHFVMNNTKILVNL